VLTGNSGGRSASGGALGGTFNNCTLTGNSAHDVGGGAFGCTLNNCTLTGNSAGQGGGAYSCTLNNCTLTGSSGGGASSCTLNNCVLTDNSGFGRGGGAESCTLNNCTLTANWAFGYYPCDRDPQCGCYRCAYVGGVGGGAYNCTLNNCIMIANSSDGSGGGAHSCTMNNCTLASNFVVATYGDGDAYGGGADYSTLTNCTLTGNSVRGAGGQIYPCCLLYYHNYGGGVSRSTLLNCTLVGNSSADYGGGAYACTLTNCIAYANTPGDNFSNSLSNCWTNDPLFVSASLRLQSNSPCINAGNNAYVVGSTDLDGNPRIAGGTVDIGAYEFQSPVSMISYAWLQQYGLPINSSTDTADPDGDAVDNYHEWLAGTDPTSALSSPAKLTIAPSGAPPSGIILTWSTNAVGFTLQSTTNLLSPAAWVTNSPAPVVIAGQNTVTNPITGPQQFYRLIH